MKYEVLVFSDLCELDEMFQMNLSGQRTARWRPKPRRPELRTVSVIQTDALLHLPDITDVPHSRPAHVSVLTRLYTAERAADTRHKVRDSQHSFQQRCRPVVCVCLFGSILCIVQVKFLQNAQTHEKLRKEENDQM